MRYTIILIFTTMFFHSCTSTTEVVKANTNPQNIEEKENDFNHASCGMIGLETAFSSSYTVLAKNHFTFEEIISFFTDAPCKVMNIKKEFLNKKQDVEIVIIDLEKKWSVKEEDIKSKSSNSGFIGEELQSRVKHTISGKNCYSNK